MAVIVFWIVIIGLPLLVILNLIYISSKIKRLTNLTKKHQFDICYLCNATSKIAIKQKLLFCMMLLFNKDTHEYGIKNMNKFFDIPDEILDNKEYLIDFFEKLSQEDSFGISIRNGKYHFEFRNR